MKKTGNTLKNPSALYPSPELMEIQSFMPIDSADLLRLKNDIKESGEIRDPIKAYYDRKTGTCLILGGYNRCMIAGELGINLIPVDIYEGTSSELRELVLKDNLNRRHLTAEQKRDLIKYFLKLDPKKSDRHIAQKTGSHHSTVSKSRKELQTGGEISHVENVTGSDGKTYKNIPQPKEKPAPVPAIDKSEKMRNLDNDQQKSEPDPNLTIHVNGDLATIKAIIVNEISQFDESKRQSFINDLILWLQSLINI